MSPFDRPRRGDETPPPDAGDSARLRIVEDRLLVLAGIDGTNGRVGTISKRVDAHGALWKWIGAFTAANAIFAATALYTAGQKSGADERELEFLRAEVAAMRAELRDLVRFRAHRHLQPAMPATGDVP